MKKKSFRFFMISLFRNLIAGVIAFYIFQKSLIKKVKEILCYNNKVTVLWVSC